MQSLQQLAARGSDPARPPALTGRVAPIDTLTPAERDRMYTLLTHYFSDTSRAQFEHDLGEKEWAVLLIDATSGVVQGFSTLMRLHATIEGRPVAAFFSGDTIIERAYWAETALPRLWSQHVFRLAAETPDTPSYWFLICSGYKTYRFLPLFFRSFYPHVNEPTPPRIHRLLDTLARQKFPDEYEPTTGVIRPTRASPLRQDVATITAQRGRDPHVAFFAQANPGHSHGDELACITALTRENLTPAGKRMVRP